MSRKFIQRPFVFAPGAGRFRHRAQDPRSPETRALFPYSPAQSNIFFARNFRNVFVEPDHRCEFDLDGGGGARPYFAPASGSAFLEIVACRSRPSSMS
jgi:hypothetical protein